MTDLDLNRLRREWSAAFIGSFLPRSDVPSPRPDLGESELTRALLCARIAMLDGRGYRASEILTLLSESHLFSTPYPEEHELDDLIKAVYWQTRFKGRFSLLDGALLPLDPDDVYLHLLEHWAAQRGRTLTPQQIQRELTQFWGVQDAQVLHTLSSLPPDPLKDYQNLISRLKAEPDVPVRNLAIGAYSHHSAVRAADLWFDRLCWNPNDIQHLFELGDDLARSQAAERVLSNTLAGTAMDSASRTTVSRALSLVRCHLEAVAGTLKGLTSRECDLLRERTADEQFQDGCLKAYLGWADPDFCDSKENRTTTGIWGPLPWWRLATDNKRQQEAAANLLTRRGATLSVDTSDPHTIEFQIREPGLGPSDLSARYSYSLKHVPDVCELLLLARRGRINIDIVGDTEENEWGEWDVLLYGTLVLDLDSELVSDLAQRATRALRARLPRTRDDDLYPGAENSQLSEILQTARFSMPEQGRFETS
ncbi:hypothetical protein AB0C10_20825 [Microbispora amethystogenes]|uniref:hypothetical protein n=1 Tax=Microbispora amethystogenes TaxID=1427754 RepID=UPI0033C0FCEE